MDGSESTSSARERAEEEQRKLQWEKENPGSRVEVRTKLRIVNQRSHRPFYDEENDQEESHTDSMQHWKALYEKQREARAKSQEIALSIGIRVCRRLQERAAVAKAKVRADQAYKEQLSSISVEQSRMDADKDNTSGEVPSTSTAAFVRAALNDITRTQVKMSIQQLKKRKRKSTLKSFE